MDFSASFQDPELCRGLLARLEREMAAYGKPVRFMEVCGTHTVAIFQSGLRSLLPPGLTHLSGPGCPVCVTHDSEVAAFLDVAGRDKTVVATFGDLLRVPGPDGRSLKHAQADGARVQVVYSPLDAVRLAEEHPGDMVVFLGVGFETTAPAVAGAVLAARQKKLDNFCVLSCHKLVPPALRALLDNDEGRYECDIDAFLLPGHVAVVLGLEPFRFVAETYGRPAVVAGFEPADILGALCLIVERLRAGRPEAANAYGRAVDEGGSPTARRVLDMGCYFGIGGVLTFKNAKKLKEAAKYIPLDYIVLETDCPYLAPEPNRGKRNSSLNLPYVAAALAQLKGVSEEEVRRAAWENGMRLYRMEQSANS